MDNREKKSAAVSCFASLRFRRLVPAGVAFAGVLITSVAHAQLDFYVLRLGDGVEVNNNYTPFSIMKYSGGIGSITLENSWTAPSTNAEDRITMGAFTTYAFLTQSVDGNFLAFTGRDAPVGGTTSNAQNVVVASFSLQSHTFDTSTRIPQVGGSGYRSAVTTDGSEFWYAGQGGGIHYAQRGQTTATSSILTTGTGNPSNIEVAGVQIIDNTIMFSRRTGSDRGIQYMPEGLHTTHGNDRFLIEGDGWQRGAGGLYNDFKFLGNDTLFVSNSGDIQVYGRRSPESENFDLLTGANQGLTGLAGENHLSVLEHDGEVYLFYTSGMGTNDNGLWSVLWDPEERVFGTPNLIATAGDGYTFGGLVAIPEPSTYAFIFGALALGAVVLLRRRRL